MNLTRQEAIKLLLGTAALAVVPSTVKAIDISPRLFKDDKIAKVDRAIRHLEDLCGKRYNPSTDSLTITVPNGDLYSREVLAHIQYTYRDATIKTSKIIKKDRLFVQMCQYPYVEHWVTYDFDTKCWHDSTGIPFALV